MTLNIRAVRPCSADQLRANVAAAVARGLSSVGDVPTRSDALHIYASGPSLRGEALVSPSMALNGAIREFTRRGQAPTWWAACDPQPIVAEFLHGSIAPSSGYIIASRCDPSVFYELTGCDVTLWHIADEGMDAMPDDAICVPDAPSVTLSALFLASMLGFRSIIVHGWDGCYSGDMSHADGSDDGKRRVEVECNGRQFVTNPSWLVEHEDAVAVLALLRAQGVSIGIAGDGLMATSLNEEIVHV